MLFCTSICANYLPKARTLAYSIKKIMPTAKVVVCILERDIPVQKDSLNIFDDVILAKDMEWDNFDSFMFRHTIVEGSTSVKGQLFLFLLKKYKDENKFVYLDPDVYVYSEFIELDELLNTYSVIIAPHLLYPGNIDMEISSLAHGCYNLGFLAISRSENSYAFLTWWNNRLFDYCYDDKKKGLFTDQRWIDLAPCFFDIHILKHHGYDFATWSLLNAEMERNDEGMYFINGDPLRFIHFSGVDGKVVDHAIKMWANKEKTYMFMTELYRDYLSCLEKNDKDSASKIKWSYNFYFNGSTISKKARIIYREKCRYHINQNPFSLNNSKIYLYNLTTARPLKKLIFHIKQYGIKATLKKIMAKVSKCVK